MYLGTRLRSFTPRLALIVCVAFAAPIVPSGAVAVGSSQGSGVQIDASTRATVSFGRFVLSNEGLPDFVPTDRIEMRLGSSYGWRLQVDTTEPMVTFRERVTLPSPAKQWGVTSDTIVAGDRASAVTVSKVYVPTHGVVDHIWTFAEGDPRGLYRFDVSVNDVHVGAGSLYVR